MPMEKKSINIVWFKRDLRLEDHAPLSAACDDGLPALMIYVFEPGLMGAPDSDTRHWRFVWQSLQNLNRTLTPPLFIHFLKGEILDVLNYIHELYTIQNIFSHQETGNNISFERDKLVSRWCKV